VGNCEVGGGGKTPIVMKIAELLKTRGLNVAIISRGYKGALKQGLVDTKVHSFRDVGDEPIILSSVAPTYIGKDRRKSIKLAIDNGAEIILMDDGYQNYTVHKDISILVKYFCKRGGGVNGNSFLLPVGPMRESQASAEKRSDINVIIAHDGDRGVDDGGNGGYIIDRDSKSMIGILKVSKPEKYYRERFIALVGIARPEKFFRSLESLSVQIVSSYIFPDHHIYQIEEIQSIYQASIENNCKIITTRKDFVRIDCAFTDRVEVLDVYIDLDESNVMSVIDRRIFGV
jgi:tetraacyldisaccharide 4'-kinase